MADQISRHIDVSLIERYFERDLDGLIAVPGTPTARLVIDPHHQLIAIRVPSDSSIPSVIPFEHIEVDQLIDEGTVWAQLSVTVADNISEVYSALCSVLDRIQLGGRSFASAVDESLAALVQLLAIRHGLSPERQLGLLGELWFLLAASDILGPDAALSAWRGPLGEEHDFGLDGVDVEIKSTAGETRCHWISSITQLVPTQGRPLLIASIQFTRGAGGSAKTLPSLIQELHDFPGISNLNLDSLLDQAGFRYEDTDLYRSRWSLRTVPKPFAVGANFPAITQAILDSALTEPNRISDVRYRVDLTGMQEAAEIELGNILSSERWT